MGFFGGYKWETNPGLAQANQYGQQAADLWAGQHSKGENYYRRILKGLKTGSTDLIGNPFLAQQAANDRLAASRADAFLPAELSQAQTRNAQAHNAENAGMAFEDYVRQMAGQAAQGTIGASQARTAGQANAYQNMANNQLQGYQGHETQGWGNMLMSGLGMAAGAASGLGWKPFA